MMEKLLNPLRKIISPDDLPKNLVRFYAVGLLLFALPFTRPFFHQITALSILLVVIVIFFHHTKWTVGTVFVFLLIAVSSFVLEVVGVKTGVLFGSYEYGSALGVKVENVPLLIGINWMYLIYASQIIIAARTNHVLLRILGGALLMILYDSVIELAAPPMQMWQFTFFYPPLDNFIVWFVASLFFHALMVVFKVAVDNKAAGALFWIQLLFFTLISIYSLLFIL